VGDFSAFRTPQARWHPKIDLTKGKRPAQYIYLCGKCRSGLCRRSAVTRPSRQQKASTRVGLQARG